MNYKFVGDYIDLVGVCTNGCTKNGAETVFSKRY